MLHQKWTRHANPLTETEEFVVQSRAAQPHHGCATPPSPAVVLAAGTRAIRYLSAPTASLQRWKMQGYQNASTAKKGAYCPFRGWRAK